MVATEFISFLFFPSSFCFLSTYYGQNRSKALAMQQGRKMGVVPGLLVPTGWWRFRQASRHDHRAWEHVRGCSCGWTPWGRWRAPDRVPAHTELRGVTEGWGGAGLRWGIGETWLREAGQWQGQGRRVTERQTDLPSSPARVNTDKKRTPVYFF